VIALFSRGEAGLALLALFFPPADVSHAFYLNPILGLLGLGTIALLFLDATVGATERLALAAVRPGGPR